MQCLGRTFSTHPIRQQLKALEKRIEELRETAASVPKFSFKRKATKSKPSTEPTVVPPPTTALTESTSTLTGSSHRYLTILDVRSPNSLAEVSISDLDSCIVNLLEDHSKITALHVRRVSRSVILLPRISGSIILHDLSESVIVVGCHQVLYIDDGPRLSVS